MPIAKGKVTKKGQALLAKIQANTPVIITKAMTGSGHVEESALPYQEDVLEPKQVMNKDDSFIYEDGKAKLNVQVSNIGLAQGYPMWQIGLYAADPDEGEILYILYQATADTVDMMLSETVLYGQSFSIKLHVVFDEASGIIVQVNPNDFVTFQILERHNSSPNAHDNRFLPLETTTELLQFTHNLSTYPQVLLGWLQNGLGVVGLGSGPLGGSDTVQVPARAVWHDSNTLTVLTTKEVAALGTNPTLHQRNDREYILTWPDNTRDSLFIRFI